MATHQCRICLEESANPRDFIAPCRCRGSAKYVHEDCLNRWRNTAGEGRNYRICGSCRFEYQLVGTNNAQIESSRQQEYFKSIMWDIAVLTGVIFCAILVVAFIFFIIDATGLLPLRKWFGDLLCINSPWLIFGMASICFILFALGVLTLAMQLTVEIALILLVAGPRLASFIIMWFGWMGLITVVEKNVDDIMDTHKTRIWAQREVRQRVRDFGEAGPP